MKQEFDALLTAKTNIPAVNSHLCITEHYLHTVLAEFFLIVLLHLTPLLQT